MLSQRDRQTLAEIEAHLRASEPRLVRSLERFRPAPSRRRRAASLRRAAGLAGVMLATLLCAVAVVLHSADFAVLAVSVALTAAGWWILLATGAFLRSRRRARGRDRGRAGRGGLG